MQQTEKSSSQSSAIAMVRRLLPSVIANDIVGVQPMGAAAGNIFTLNITYSPIKIGPWTKTFVCYPRKTIGGVYRMGRLNVRLVEKLVRLGTIEHPFGGEMTRPHYEESYQYATDKELFVLTLEGEDDVAV